MQTTKPPTTTSPASFKPEIPRRVVEIPGAPVRRPAGEGIASPLSGGSPVSSASLSTSGNEMRKLIVGRDISLSGEISACDVLVVEGTVEAKLRDGRNIEIAESGLFKGSVEIDEADIGGRFEGDISVRGRLRLRSTGRITGSIRYGELEVEAGGQLIGEIQVLTTNSGTGSVTRMPSSEPVTADTVLARSNSAE
jgi:cytoskeletal protein CcmA (bactofilin family)